MGSFTPAKITLSHEDGSDFWILEDALTFTDETRVKWTAPEGTRTDGASVPRLALPVSDGRFHKGFIRAALVHDAYCQEINREFCPDQYRSRSWRDTHRMFYEACLAGGTPLVTAKVMYSAVWTGGPRWGDPESKREKDRKEASRFGLVGIISWIKNAVPGFEEIEQELPKTETLLLDHFEMEQNVITALYKERNIPSAKDLLEEQDRRLREDSELLPEELMLVNFRGYMLKNEGYVLLAERKPNEAAAALEGAERCFERVLEQEPEDPSAHNGLGSVWMLRRDFQRSKLHIERALEIEPDYWAAKQDLETVSRWLKGQNQC